MLRWVSVTQPQSWFGRVQGAAWHSSNAVGLRAASLLLFGVVAVGCGSESSDEPPWVGRTYLLDIPANNWTEPQGVGSEIGMFVPQFLIAVEGSAEGELDVVVGTAEAGEQSECNPTTNVSMATSDFPEVQVGPFEFTAVITGLEENTLAANIHDLTFTNVLPEAGDPPDEGEVLATVDSRELFPLFTLITNPTPERVCAALDSFEAMCEACPTDGEEFCLTLRAQAVGASEFATGTIERIDEVDESCLTVVAE